MATCNVVDLEKYLNVVKGKLNKLVTDSSKESVYLIP